MNQKKIMRAVSLALAMTVFTGCSMGNTASVMPEASGSTISEEAVRKDEVSGSAVSGNMTGRDSQDKETKEPSRQVGNPSTNDDNEYVRDRYGDAIVQYDLKGNLIKTIPMDIDGVEWVTNEWLYYTSGYDGGLWRIPIEKTEKGDHLKIKKQERLLKKNGNDYYIIYMTDSYFLMEKWNDEKEGICKYELESGKITDVIGSEELGEDEELEFYDDEMCNLIVINGNLFFEGEKELFCLDLESGESNVIYSTGRYGISSYEKSGNVLYFLLDNALYQYDSISKKVACLISEESFIKEVDKLGLGFVVDPDVTEIYLDKGTMYFILKAEWLRKGKKGFYEKDELFSAPEGHFEQLHREDKLMDYLDKKGWYKKDTEEDYFISYENTSGINEFYDGSVYASWYLTEESVECQVVKYDLTTKKIKKVSGGSK